MSRAKKGTAQGRSSGHVTAANAAERDEASASAAGEGYVWHSGTLTAVGADGTRRTASVTWDEGFQSHGGHPIGDDAWQVLRLAFQTTRRIRVLSARGGTGWAFDFERVEACSL